MFAHLAWAQHILNTGSITTFYPLSHILIVDLQFTGLPLETAAQLLPVIFTILLILFLLILGRALNKGPWISLFPILFSLPLIYGMFHRTFHPYFFALFFIPLFFFLLFKSFNHPEMKQYPILLIIVSFFIVFVHPMITVVLIVFTLSLFVLSNYIGKKGWTPRLIFISLILTISFCMWYLSFRTALTQIGNIYSALFDQTNSAETIIEYQVTSIQTSDAPLHYITKLFLLNYGLIFSYLIFGIIFSIFIFSMSRQKKASDIQLIFSIQFIIGLIIAGMFVAAYFILFEPIRAAAPAIMMATIFIPIVLSGRLSGICPTHIKKILFSLIALFFVISASVSFLTIFSSPIISSSSQHMTYMEKDGLDWFLYSRNDAIPVVLFVNSLSYNKYESFFYEKHYFLPLSTEERIKYLKKIPSHFGYDNHQRLAETLDYNEYYFLSTELNRESYLAVPDDRREIVPKLTSADFKQLKKDNSTNLLYSSGEFESWWIPAGIIL